MNSIKVRAATVNDAESILEIYSYYVENTAISFEYTAPTLPEFRERMKKTMKKYPYIVVETDGAINGYAYAGAFSERAAYDWACETTIYLAHTAQKRGLGRLLYTELEKRLVDMGITNLYARIGYPDIEDKYLTKNSAGFHSRLGYTTVGSFRNCGYKFGKWYNMICMEKIIGNHLKNQPYVKFYDIM